jgi:DNA-binding transcriptional LysR family regulator
MSELTLLGLRVVSEVAAHGSFTAAADALGYTQSAVSRQVAAMEQAAGSPLFERLARGVRPTDAGLVLLRHAGPVLERVDAAALELGGLRDRLEGRLALGAFPSALGALVPRALARLRRRYPAIVVILREGTTPAQLRRLRAGRLELAVIALDTEAGTEARIALDDLQTDILLEGRLLVAVPSTHHLAQRGTVDVTELEDGPWIVGDSGGWDSGGGDPLLGSWPGSAAAPRIAHSVRDWPARLGLVAAGLGLAVVPSIAASTVPAGVRLVAVDDPRPVRRSVAAVTRPDRSPATAALIQALRQEAALIAEATERSVSS